MQIIKINKNKIKKINHQLAKKRKHSKRKKLIIINQELIYHFLIF